MKTQFLVLAFLAFTFATTAQSQSAHLPYLREKNHAPADVMQVQIPALYSDAARTAAEGCLLDSSYDYSSEGVLIWKTIYQCNAQGYQTDVLSSSWDGSAWVNEYLTTYTYDAQGNLTEELTQDWDGSEWLNSYLSTYTYDAQGNQTELVLQVWNGSSWDNDFHRANTYDAQDNLTEVLNQNWSGSLWANSSLVTSVYDAQGNLIEQLLQSWDGSMWVNGSLYSMTYDAQGNLTEKVIQNWYVNAWANGYLSTYIYDAQGNLTEELIQYWEGGMVWADYSRYTYTYDAHGNQIGQVNQSWIGNVWTTQVSYQNFYDCTGLSVEEQVKGHDLHIWPNPASSILSITTGIEELQTIAIYTINGQKLSEQPFTPQMDISDLPIGIYIIELRSEGVVVRQRFVKM